MSGNVINGDRVMEASKRVAQRIREVQAKHGKRCPECGGHSIEDNGSTEYRCVACDHRWGTDAGQRYGY